MLSLLSLLLASGTVLRADTERWTSLHYPNPRRNHTGCNVWPNSTLCDPDHILTDQWRAQINENIQKQMQKLTEANVPLAEKAPPECSNRTEGVTIFVLLAKRIWTPNNQTITGNDLTNFGDELAKQYGLNDLPCKTFLLLIGIEAAKLAYVRTGKDLRLPADLMQRVFHEYKLFNAKNFMAGLNKIVDEIGTQMADPFKDQFSTTISNRIRQSNNSVNSAPTSTDSTTLAEIVAAMEETNGGGNGTTAVDGTVDGEVENDGGNQGKSTMAYWFVFLSLGTAILLAFGSLALLAIAQQKQQEQMEKGGPKRDLMQTIFGGFVGGDEQQSSPTENEMTQNDAENDDGQNIVENLENEKASATGGELILEMTVEEEEEMEKSDPLENGNNIENEPKDRRNTESLLMEGKVCPEGASMEVEGQSSSGGSDFEEVAENTVPKVRIGAAELVTDILMIGGKKTGEK